jgi:hypothetical protein
MHTDPRNNPSGRQEEGLPTAPTGNASNPSPHSGEPAPAATQQVLDKKAETYLRESANIEDLPDAEDQQEGDYELGGGD